MPDTVAAKARLEAQLAELKDRLGRIETDLDEPINPDLSEQATEMQDDDALGGQAELVARWLLPSEQAENPAPQQRDQQQARRDGDDDRRREHRV